MKQEEIINGFSQLGKVMVALGENKAWTDFSLGITKEEYDKLNALVDRQIAYNGWFTRKSVNTSLRALGEQLSTQLLGNWAEKYKFSVSPKSIGLIMAGNIPLVGFHDFICVLISGHKAVCKLSSDDKTLLPALAEILIQFTPELKSNIEFTLGKIGVIDAVIATGSNNSLKYFEQYFGKYPHIFRKNRTSVAVFKGDESKEEIEKLGEDIFTYFGLGCRNVSHLIFPEGFELSQFFEGIFSYNEVVYNNKYGNNYDYNKAIFLLNKHNLLDNNFVLLRETTDLHSPLSMLHYHYYADEKEVNTYLEEHKKDIQVIVGKDFVPFGSAQKPKLDDYADGVDVMEWLGNL